MADWRAESTEYHAHAQRVSILHLMKLSFNWSNNSVDGSMIPMYGQRAMEDVQVEPVLASVQHTVVEYTIDPHPIPKPSARTWFPISQTTLLRIGQETM